MMIFVLLLYTGFTLLIGYAIIEIYAKFALKGSQQQVIQPDPNSHKNHEVNEKKKLVKKKRKFFHPIPNENISHLENF